MKYVLEQREMTGVAHETTKRECQNRYRSVASQMMLPEIERVVSGTSSGSDTQDLLVKELMRYTGAPADRIAVASETATIVNALIRSAGAGARRVTHVTRVTHVGPITTVADEAKPYPAHVISSLADTRRTAIARAIPASTELLYLASPNPLSGEVYSASQIRRILENVGSALVVVDESLFEYCKATCVTLLDEFDNLVILRTLKEAFGLEHTPLAYALGASEIIERLQNLISPDKLSLVTEVTAIAALRRADVMRQAVNIVCENRVYLTALLRRLGAEVIPTASDFVLVRVMQPELALSALGSYGVTLCEFETAGEPGRYLRIPIGDESYCRSIVAAFTRCPREYYMPLPRSHGRFTEEEPMRRTAPESYRNPIAGNVRREHKNIHRNTKETQR